MAMIMFVKVFQFRHPDLSANAYKVILTKEKNIYNHDLYSCFS